ncbi:hypothetical protein NUW58_g3743 [Xylaria curta]|uniref:Uncharacterized protein n=2 Tax=Xylaria curta TaxID=42375 RepID=A0ACC1PAH8_9PEZI|nr:hypothetical protein NUW58_g3903 [Xylaria curta]KAJ2988885.1 hypothetical protein NUW58_g3743 [Xylaria curta]
MALVGASSDLRHVLMQTVDEYHCKGLIGPIRPLTVINAEKLPSSSTLLPDVHERVLTGGLAKSFTSPGSLVATMSPQTNARFDPEASYIISGGECRRLASIIRWMGDRGARNLILLSDREDGRPEEMLTAHGNVDVQWIVCDMLAEDQVLSLIQKASSLNYHSSSRIKGLLHLSGSNACASLLQGLVAEAQTMKILHDATLSCSLDFFVMTTISGLQDSCGPIESLQRSFARYRRQLGLPVSTVSTRVIFDLHLDENGSIQQGLNETTDQNDAQRILTDYQFFRFLEPAFFKPNVTSPLSQLNPSPEEWPGEGKDMLSGISVIALAAPETMVSASCIGALEAPNNAAGIAVAKSPGPSRNHLLVAYVGLETGAYLTPSPSV